MKLFNSKYRFFNKKVKDVTKSIWELEFKIEKSRQVREGVRQDRDKTMEFIYQTKAHLEGTTDKELKEKLQADITLAENNSTRYEAQMKMIDNQINGRPVEGEDPGEQGIMDTVKSLIELRGMYKDYLKKL